MIVELTADDRWRAFEAAQRTQQDVKANQRTDSVAYQRELSMPRLQADYMACLAEIAVANHLELPWGGFWIGAVDVGDSIEVRRVNHPEHGLLIRPKDVEDIRVTTNAAVYVHDDEHHADILGWVPTLAAWQRGFECVCVRRGTCCTSFTDSNTLVLHRRHLRPITTLEIST